MSMQNMEAAMRNACIHAGVHMHVTGIECQHGLAECELQAFSYKNLNVISVVVHI